MIKKDVLKLIREKEKEGYITHELILCLWKDDEDIDEKYLCLFYQKPERRENIILTGITGMKYFEQGLKRKII